MTLPILILQVTLWLLLGACLYLWSVRQGPRTAARCLSLVLGGVLLLSVVALLPLPGWPLENSLSWLVPEERSQTPKLPEPTVRIENETADDAGAAASPFGFKLSSLLPRQMPVGKMAESAPAAPGVFSWEQAALAVMFACGFCGLVRLLIGLWAVRECRRRSVPVNDEGMQHLCDAFGAEMGLTQRVELRTLAGLGSPATMGWRKPILLLPENWTVWSEEERRSVLAHELAHVQAGDYGRWLLAQLGAALHGYQPLVHWLLARLHREQELAADLVAARHAGGTGIYLRSLCRLALAQEDGKQPFPARTFLPVRFSLIRRITMLRSWKNEGGTVPTRLRRFGGLALLLLLGLGVAGVRSVGWAQEKVEEPAAIPMADAKLPATPAAPFVLNYVRKDAPGIIAVRPSAVCLHPAAKPLLEKANFAVKSFMKDMAGQDGDCLGVEQIEQIVSEMEIRPKTAKMDGGIMMNLNTIRLVEGSRWQPFLAVRFPKLEWKQHGNAKYVQMPALSLPDLHRAFNIYPICLYMPDERTLVFPTERQLQQLLTEGMPQTPTFAWQETWRSFEKEGCHLAVGVDAKRAQQALGLGPNSPQLKPWAHLLEDSASLVFAGCLQDKVCFGVRATPTEGANLEKFSQKVTDAFRAMLPESPITLVLPVAGAPKGFPLTPSGKIVPPAAIPPAVAPMAHSRPLLNGQLVASAGTVTFAGKPGDAKLTPVGWWTFFPDGQRLPVRAYIWTTVSATDFLKTMLPPLDYDAKGEMPSEPDLVFQAEVKLLEVPVALVEQFGHKQFADKWPERKKSPVILSAEQAKAVLEMVQGDVRASVLCAPTVQTLPGETASIEVGPQEGGPGWQCKLTLTDAPDSKGIRVEAKGEYHANVQAKPPETSENPSKPKHKRVVAWNFLAAEMVPPGHSMLVLGRLEEKPAPGETMILFLATPSREPLKK